MLNMIRYLFYIAMVLLMLFAACYVLVSWRAKQQLYDSVEQLPHYKVALVLGTSKYLRGGSLNAFYQHRIDAAITLYRSGKVDYFVVSGDNRKRNYNEPKQMQKDLLKAGIPIERIQPDYAGFRTLDSVLRMDKVFGHKTYLIISQRFHNQRALFLAKSHGQTPAAFNAANPKQQSMKKVMLREVLARVKAVLDVITDKQAKFYGDRIIFPNDEAEVRAKKVSREKNGGD